MTRDELKSTFDAWYTSWDAANSNSLTQDQVQSGLNLAFPAPAPPDYAGAMMAALPTTPGARPLRPRKILVYGRSAGFVHSAIPLTAKTVEALGNKGNLWTTSFSYDPNDINTANLIQYDAIFLNSTTGCFLDDPDRAASLARRQAFLEFVRSGKGVAGITCATDSYHRIAMTRQRQRLRRTRLRVAMQVAEAVAAAVWRLLLRRNSLHRATRIRT